MTSTEPRTDIFEDRPDEPISDELLLQAARDGSTGAFGVLYARHREHAVAVARSTLGSGDAALAEDVAEAAFIDVFGALRNGKGPTDTLRHYLTTAVRRQAWRVQRRARRQAETADRWTTEQAVAGALAQPGVDPVASEELGSHVLLREAFGGLSERWRHVLWLTEVEGRKPSEIAPLLGVSAGTASALAYRARQGLLAAYVGAYRARRTDPTCQQLGDRLAAFVAAAPGAPGFDDVHAHLEGCASCRDLARGVDVGVVLGAFAPFGLLTAGWWAKPIAAGGAKVAAAVLGGSAAGGAGAAGAASTAPAASGAASSGAGAGGGAGVLGAVAAGVAAVAVVAGAAFGLARGPAPEPADAAAAAGAAVLADREEVEGAALDAPGGVVASTTSTGSIPTVPETTATAPADAGPSSPGAPPAPARPADRTTLPPTTTERPTTTGVPTTAISTTTGVPTTTGAPTTTAPTTTGVPTTTAPTTTPTTPTTTRPDDPDDGGVLSGGVVELVDGGSRPVAGVRIVATTLLRQATTTTGADGRWAFDQLAPGTYLVVAEVPAAYRPATGLDPWLGGPTWSAVLGVVQVGDGAVDLVDLRLVGR